MSRLLLADGDTVFSEFVSNHFQSLNFGVIKASNYREATTCVKSRSDIDVIILGLNMPDMDGIETLRRVRELSPNAEVIVMADRFSTDDVLEALKIGAWEYIWKPFDMKRLVEKVEQAAARKTGSA